MNYVIQVYRNYAAFDGRARRMEYWIFTGFTAAVVVLTLLLAQLGTDGSARGPRIFGGAVLTLFILGSIVPSFALRIRRLHDINRTGYWILIAFLPIIGSVLLLVFSLLPGTRGANRFGPDPKAVDSELSEVFA